MRISQEKNGYAVALAAGLFFGAALFDALPEASARLGIFFALFWMASGAILWWLSRRVLRALKKPEMSPLVAGSLWFHSVLEGVVTGLAFGISYSVGYLVLGAMILHLLPEFFAAVALMRAAASTDRASLITVFAGYLILFASFAITFITLPQLGDIIPIATSMSGGAFIYIGAASYWKKRSIITFPFFTAGIIIVFLQSRFFNF